MFFDDLFSKINTGSVLGVEQGVQVPTRDVGLGVVGIEQQPGVGAYEDLKKRHVVVVGVEHPPHSLAPQTYGAENVRTIDFAELHLPPVTSRQVV